MGVKLLGLLNYSDSVGWACNTHSTTSRIALNMLLPDLIFIFLNKKVPTLATLLQGEFAWRKITFPWRDRKKGGCSPSPTYFQLPTVPK